MSKYEQACIALGQRILKRREELGLTQEQLSKAVGVSRQALSDWELGKYPPHYRHLPKLAKSLGMSVADLGPFADVA